MIIDMRTYSYRPGTVPKALERIALGLAERTTLSPLAGLWQTESGRLHQIVHLWPYADLAERERVRGQFKTLTNWPARTGEYMESSETKIMEVAPFSPPLTPRTAGPVYEVCTDTYASGKLRVILDTWGEAMERDKPPSFIGAWSTEIGPMNQWVHIWAWPSIAERTAQRKRVAEIASMNGKHDPASIFIRQDTSLCTPAHFSPLQ